MVRGAVRVYREGIYARCMPGEGGRFWEVPARLFNRKGIQVQNLLPLALLPMHMSSLSNVLFCWVQVRGMGKWLKV